MTFLLIHCCPGQKNTSKNILGCFNKIWHCHTKLKRCRSGYQPMFPTSFLKKNGPLQHSIQILSILVSRVLESKVSATHHKSLEALKTKLWKEWSKLQQDVMCDSCRSFSRHLQLIIDSNGKHIE